MKIPQNSWKTPKMLIQGPGGTLRTQNWALRPLPLFLAYKLGLETASTSSWFSKKGFAEPIIQSFCYHEDASLALWALLRNIY